MREQAARKTIDPVFDIKEAFTGDRYPAQAVRTLISDTKSFTEPADISDDTVALKIVGFGTE
jgi:hypothetical protein